MPTCISCDRRYYLDDTGCTFRFCGQECLQHHTADHLGPGWAGDINEVFEERDRLRDEVKELTADKEPETATTDKPPEFQLQNFITIFRNGVSSELACARWTDGDHRAYFHGHSFIGSKEYIAAEVQKIIAEQEKAGWTDQQIFPYPAPDDEEPPDDEAKSPEPTAVLVERAMKDAWRYAAIMMDAAQLQTSNKEEMRERAHNAMARARELEAHDQWYPRARRKLDSLNFEGVNPVSYMSAQELLVILEKCNFKPNRIIRTAEALISLWFTEWAVSFRVECCEDGAFVISTMGLNPTHTEHGTAAEVAAELTSDDQN